MNGIFFVHFLLFVGKIVSFVKNRIPMYDFTIIIKSKDNVVPFNYEHDLHAFVYSHISDVGYGSKVKNFIHSNLKESNISKCKVPCGVWSKKGISFYTDPCFTIRTNDISVANSIVKNIKVGVSVFGGFKVVDFYAYEVEDLHYKTKFNTFFSSPILVSPKWNKYKTIPEEILCDVENYLEKNVERKANEIGVTLGEFKIKIEKQFKCCDIMTKKYTEDEFGNAFKETGRNFLLSITGTDIAKNFIYQNGLGRSVGLGFGFLNVK